MTAAEDGKRTDEAKPAVPVSPAAGEVAVHRSAPDRVVFVEKGNSDGWISTDETVEVSR